MLIGADATINTATFTATTLDIDPAKFMQGGALELSRSALMPEDAKIINEGKITVGEAGLVALVAPQVVNEGLIMAKLGRVQLASGTAATLDISGDGLLNIALDPEVAGEITNSGVIEGQYVRIGGGMAGQFVNAAVNLDGVIRASGLSDGGSIEVQSTGDVLINGTCRPTAGGSSRRQHQDPG